MDIDFSVLKSGVKVRFNKKTFNLKIPKKIWSIYPYKEELLDNLAYVSSVNIPVIARKNELIYNTCKPIIKKLVNKIILGNVPNAVEDYRDNTSKTIKRFHNIKYIFNGESKIPSFQESLSEGCIVPLSCGKDSLLTLGICNEIGLKPVCVYVNDTVSSTENNLKLNYNKAISKEFNLKSVIIRNEIEQLNDFDYWKKGETCLGYTHLTTGFCLMSLPLMYYFDKKHIILGNQQDMNFSFINKDGYKTYPSYDQTNEGTELQNRIVKKMTNNHGSVFSVIKPVTNIAAMKILFNRYSSLAKYQISCDCLDGTNEKRWCHDCNKCARLFLFMKAFGFDGKLVGLRNLFEREFKNYYTLFDSKQDCYEKSKESRDQQLLGFYLAYRNNQKGYLVDHFKKNYLQEAKEREDELHKTFFKVYNSNMPNKIKNKVSSIYKEELNNI